MEKSKGLTRWQKGILLCMLLMALAFALVYPVTISKVGFDYMDTILVPSQENGSTVYSGKIQGQPAQFTVSEDKTVVFQHGGKTYGPYTAKEDPAAIPKDSELAESMTGVELYQGENLLFRGGILKMADSYVLYNEDGSLDNFSLFYVTSGDGRVWDENGRAADPVKPPASVILALMNDPELTHKGDWLMWFSAVGVCILNALSILFADELFRWDLALRIRNADCAEPSDWELAGRYISWTVLTVIALALFILGLR